MSLQAGKTGDVVDAVSRNAAKFSMHFDAVSTLREISLHFGVFRTLGEMLKFRKGRTRLGAFPAVFSELTAPSGGRRDIAVAQLVKRKHVLISTLYTDREGGGGECSGGCGCDTWGYWLTPLYGHCEDGAGQCSGGCGCDTWGYWLTLYYTDCEAG